MDMKGTGGAQMLGGSAENLRLFCWVLCLGLAHYQHPILKTEGISRGSCVTSDRRDDIS